MKKRVYKKGDKIIFSEEKIFKKLGKIPIWYTNQIFTIIEICDDVDNDGYQIAIVDKSIKKDSYLYNSFNNSLSTIYVVPHINKTRKDKLNKINEKMFMY